MKPLILFAALLAMIPMTSCSVKNSSGSESASVSSDSAEPCAPPDQEMLFLITDEVFSDSPYFTEATVLTTDGRMLDASDAIYDSEHERRKDWQTQLQQLVKDAEESPSVPQDDLYRMYRFFEHADALDGLEMTEYEEPVDDIGKWYLYLLLKQDDGEYRQIQLCVSGESNKYLNDEAVIQFVEWMDQQNYYVILK